MATAPSPCVSRPGSPVDNEGFITPRRQAKLIAPLFKRPFTSLTDATLKRARTSADAFIPTPTSNAFAVLAPATDSSEPVPAAMEEDPASSQGVNPEPSTARPSRAKRPPPLVVYDVEDVRAFRDLIRSAVTDQSFTVSYGESSARVQTRNIEDFHSLRKALSEADAQMSTWGVGEEKTTAFTFRGLSSRHQVNDLLEDLRDIGVDARRARQLTSEGKPIGVFVVNIASNNKWPISSIKALRSVGNNVVSVRLYVYRDPQLCHRCSRFGHGSFFCSASPPCPLCSGAHHLEDCARNGEEKCPSCNGAHSAFSPQCPKWIAEKERRAEKPSQKRRGRGPAAAPYTRAPTSHAPTNTFPVASLGTRNQKRVERRRRIPRISSSASNSTYAPGNTIPSPPGSCSEHH
ncbi:uncharacterized protein [Hetaerina americana]|uniref:uncharacterized protein n=1 Tax=Hetaerina americana TaxID=62018 RepID=UPI003A7F3142